MPYFNNNQHRKAIGNYNNVRIDNNLKEINSFLNAKHQLMYNRPMPFEYKGGPLPQDFVENIRTSVKTSDEISLFGSILLLMQISADVNQNIQRLESRPPILQKAENTQNQNSNITTINNNSTLNFVKSSIQPVDTYLPFKNNNTIVQTPQYYKDDVIIEDVEDDYEIEDIIDMDLSSRRKKRDIFEYKKPTDIVEKNLFHIPPNLQKSFVIFFNNMNPSLTSFYKILLQHKKGTEPFFRFFQFKVADRDFNTKLNKDGSQLAISNIFNKRGQIKNPALLEQKLKDEAFTYIAQKIKNSNFIDTVEENYRVGLRNALYFLERYPKSQISSQTIGFLQKIKLAEDKRNPLEFAKFYLSLELKKLDHKHDFFAFPAIDKTMDNYTENIKKIDFIIRAFNPEFYKHNKDLYKDILREVNSYEARFFEQHTNNKDLNLKEKLYISLVANNNDISHQEKMKIVNSIRFIDKQDMKNLELLLSKNFKLFDISKNINSNNAFYYDDKSDFIKVNFKNLANQNNQKELSYCLKKAIHKNVAKLYSEKDDLSHFSTSEEVAKKQMENYFNTLEQALYLMHNSRNQNSVKLSLDPIKQSTLLKNIENEIKKRSDMLQSGSFDIFKADQNIISDLENISYLTESANSNSLIHKANNIKTYIDDELKRDISIMQTRQFDNRRKAFNLFDKSKYSQSDIVKTINHLDPVDLEKLSHSPNIIFQNPAEDRIGKVKFANVISNSKVNQASTTSTTTTPTIPTKEQEVKIYNPLEIREILLNSFGFGFTKETMDRLMSVLPNVENVGTLISNIKKYEEQNPSKKFFDTVCSINKDKENPNSIQSIIDYVAEVKGSSPMLTSPTLQSDFLATTNKPQTTKKIPTSSTTSEAKKIQYDDTFFNNQNILYEAFDGKIPNVFVCKAVSILETSPELKQIIQKIQDYNLQNPSKPFFAIDSEPQQFYSLIKIIYESLGFALAKDIIRKFKVDISKDDKIQTPITNSLHVNQTISKPEAKFIIIECLPSNIKKSEVDKIIKGLELDDNLTSMAKHIIYFKAQNPQKSFFNETNPTDTVSKINQFEIRSELYNAFDPNFSKDKIDKIVALLESNTEIDKILNHLRQSTEKYFFKFSEIGLNDAENLKIIFEKSLPPTLASECVAKLNEVNLNELKPKNLQNNLDFEYNSLPEVSKIIIISEFPENTKKQEIDVFINKLEQENKLQDFATEISKFKTSNPQENFFTTPSINILTSSENTSKSTSNTSPTFIIDNDKKQKFLEARPNTIHSIIGFKEKYSELEKRMILFESFSPKYTKATIDNYIAILFHDPEIDNFVKNVVEHNINNPDKPFFENIKIQYTESEKKKILLESFDTTFRSNTSATIIKLLMKDSKLDDLIQLISDYKELNPCIPFFKNPDSIFILDGKVIFNLPNLKGSLDDNFKNCQNAYQFVKENGYFENEKTLNECTSEEKAYNVKIAGNIKEERSKINKNRIDLNICADLASGNEVIFNEGIATGVSNLQKCSNSNGKSLLSNFNVASYQNNASLKSKLFNCQLKDGEVKCTENLR